MIKINVEGLVQGVGFRPYVYNLALRLNLKGYVNNDDSGVNICLQGSLDAIDEFLYELEHNPPVLSNITAIRKETIETNETFNCFEIIQSSSNAQKTTIISPDIAICQDCMNDISEEDNFRYEYSLTNCTNCGPRYSIIKTVPYDRENTSMEKFQMCEVCNDEYINPSNRRYHAQPVSCETCGPEVLLYDNSDAIVAKDNDAIKTVAQHINEGKIIAMKGLGGFHLICDATNDTTIELLRQRKHRPVKPFAVMFKDFSQLNDFAKVSIAEKNIITSKEKPIVLVKKRKLTSLGQLVAPKIDRLGVFLPYTPLHCVLFKYLNNPFVATSANISEEPIIISKNELIDQLSHVFDYVLDFNRDIVNACDDSVVQCINDDISVIRNARGYAPSIIKLPKKTDKKILAIGANQKNTIALAFEDNLILSPFIGDLQSINSMDFFKRTIDTFKRFYDFEPDMIVCDKHPSYETTKWASYESKKQHIPLIQIQHHYAHVLSTMAEYNLKGDVLAFAFDGTGYGDDGKIWGGEVFFANQKEYDRKYHLKYFKLLGSEKAIKEPKRVALSLLFDNYSFEEVTALDSPTVHSFNESELKLMYTVWEKELNAPQTSSVGRLFDAVASLAGVIQVQRFEGESGLKLEELYNWNRPQAYEYEIVDGQIDLSKAIKAMIQDNESSVIATKFINMLSNIVVDISNENENLPVLLTGGVFQNKTLLELTTKRLEVLGRTFYFSKRIPLNDSGISVGQIYSQMNY